MPIQTYAKKYLPRPVVDVLRVMRYRLDLATFQKRIVTHSYGGHVLEMNVCDRVGGEWYDKDWELPPEIAFLSKERVPRAGRVFDLGAHQCLIAMLLGREIAPEGSVVAVEANRHNAEVARSNLALNEANNVEVVHALISSQMGRARADSSFNSRARETTEGVGELVEALSIDDLSLLKGWPDLVYMDIEGFEMKALEGAPQTLQRRCHWFIELHGDETLSRYGAKNSDVFQFFDYRDFACYLCLEGEDKFRPVIDGAPLPSGRCFLIFAPRSARLINHASDQHTQWQ